MKKKKYKRIKKINNHKIKPNKNLNQINYKKIQIILNKNQKI